MHFLSVARFGHNNVEASLKALPPLDEAVNSAHSLCNLNRIKYANCKAIRVLSPHGRFLRKQKHLNLDVGHHRNAKTHKFTHDDV